MTEAVQIRDACVDYGDVRAVDRVSLDVAHDTVHVLLGHSGSGKTTLLRAIAGFEPLSSGQIVVAGRTVDDGTRAGWVAPEHRKIGFVFQDYALFTHLDASRNIAFGVPKSSRAQTSSHWLSRIRLPEHGTRRPGELSGGEQQRVALARAMAPEPGLVLLDEPFSNLDPHLRREVRDNTVALIRENGATAIFVTHDVEEAFSVADRVSVLENGRITQTGTPRELYEQPVSRHIARLCGPATFVTIDAVTDGRAVCVLGEVETSGTPEVGTTLVLRPEHLEVSPGEAATVVRRRFLGGCDECELAFGDQTITVRPPTGSVTSDTVNVRVVGRPTVVRR